MNDFWADGWKAILAHNDLDEFEALWNLPAEWFEPPNHRRGGWSGVSRICLSDPDGGEVHVFLKRQENHTRKTWRHPISREPTFRSEARNLMALNRLHIGAPELLYYAERKTSRGWQVILATRELQDQLPLDRLIASWLSEGWSQTRAERHELILALADLLRRLHDTRRSHNALHAKHVFVHRASRSPCLIDLEKMYQRFSRRKAMIRDLDALNRRTPAISRSERLRFLLAYAKEPHLTPALRKVIRELLALQQRKSRRRGK